MIKFKIENLSKEILTKLYIKNKFSTWKIEKLHGIPRGTVYRKLKFFSIPTRNRATSHIIYDRKSFNGNKKEKAYLIGFSLGDLRVRKVYSNSETIHVDCGSTKINQISLIKNLFKDYGRVWISKPRKNKIQVEAFLDDSFNFLLNKEIPNWILENRGYFLNFLAGFTDAEGSFYVTNKQGRFSIGNYNSKILDLISKELIDIGIECTKPYEDNTKGYIGKDGYIRKQNYWQIYVRKKESLFKLIKLLKNRLRHKDRIKSLTQVNRNLVDRSKGDKLY